MITLTQCTKTYGDCTAGYTVTMKKQYYVREFIEEVLTRGEWGTIGIFNESQEWFQKGEPYCEYKRNTVLNEMPFEYMDKIVLKATAHGGWSNMDFKLHI